MGDNYYEPESLPVHVGDQVEWKNDGGTEHNAESTAGFTFNTGDVSPGETSAPITFSVPSDSVGFEYSCTNHHPQMIGHIIVALAGSNLQAMKTKLSKGTGKKKH
jgi:plastocyanin